MIRSRPWLFIAAGIFALTARADDVQVNAYTTDTQRSPSVAAAPDGAFIVVWTSDGPAPVSALDYSLEAQLYASGGEPVGGQFRVNSYTTEGAFDPRVAVAPDGDFVVVWHNYRPGDYAQQSYDIQARRFASDGSPRGDQFQVNLDTPGIRYYPAVATSTDGDFVVVWSSFYYDYVYPPVSSVQARRFSSDGTPLGSEFQVNAYTTEYRARPSVATGPGGQFIVVWHSDGSTGDDASGSSIQLRRFASDGSPMGVEVQVNTHTTGAQRRAEVAADAAGDFVIVWQSRGSPGGDTLFDSIQARRYASGGAPLGDQFQVNVYTPGQQERPDVAADPDGNFIVVWHSDGSNGSDGSFSSIHARAFIAGGSPLTGDLQVNTFTTGSQEFPSVALRPDGDFVIAWSSYGSGGTDTSGTSIQKTPAALIFADGFESGDTSSWSSTTTP